MGYHKFPPPFNNIFTQNPYKSHIFIPSTSCSSSMNANMLNSCKNNVMHNDRTKKYKGKSIADESNVKYYCKSFDYIPVLP